jgi:glycosyltransferase involved in cell wall biosynthesis
MDDADSLCLDLTRLVRRAGHPTLTGIDRVELAYLRYLLSRTDRETFALVRIGRRLALLGRKGIEELARRIADGGPWGPGGLGARLLRRKWADAESTVASLAVARIFPGAAERTLASHMPAGTVYINVGHTNLVPDVFGAIAAVPGARSIVFVHDTIPLDHPELQRDGTVVAFQGRLRAVARYADRIVVPSQSVAEDVTRHFKDSGRLPPIVAAPPGVERLQSTARPPVTGDRPYFVCLGTIEPRKNHALLLDLWEDLHRTLPEDRIPLLYLVGRRGWKNRAVFDRLDRLPFMGRTLVELGELPDSLLGPLLAGAASLLQPSRAEGFGFPPHEALALGTIPVCAPLPVYRETLGDAAIYADIGDLYQWRNAVLRLSESGGTGPRQTPGDTCAAYVPPTWEAHFKLALTPIC